MNPDRVELQERMRSLTVGELRRIAANRDGEQDAAEVLAANQELALRFSALGDGAPRKEHGTGDDVMPVGLRIVFYLAWCVAAIEVLFFIFMIATFLSANVRAGLFIGAVLRFGVSAAWIIWIAVTVQSEHRYARGLLLALLSIAITARLALGVLEQDFSYTRKMVIGLMAVAFCYVAFSGAVRRHYAATSDVDAA